MMKNSPENSTNLFENSNQVMTSVHYSYAQTANEFSTLFDGEEFSHPKPVNDIKSLIAYLSNTDDLIVDFLLAQAHLGIQFFYKMQKIMLIADLF
jgi:adenine-specific DNA-methyltransferase